MGVDGPDGSEKATIFVWFRLPPLLMSDNFNVFSLNLA